MYAAAGTFCRFCEKMTLRRLTGNRQAGSIIREEEAQQCDLSYIIS